MPVLRISSLRCHDGHSIGVSRLHGRSLATAISASANRASANRALWIATLAVAIATACGGSASRAADDAPAAGTALPKPAAAPMAPPAFQPEDISIGEPISLPRATPLAAPAPGRPPYPPSSGQAGSSFQPNPSQLPSVVAPATPAAAMVPPTDAGAAVQPSAAGTGWLGIAVDDTVVTGRLVVVEVAPDGPAAKAGVRPQDMLLAINGNQLKNGDELAAALAAITPGQQVKMAVGRDNRVEDVVAQASARPPEAVSRDWQSAPAGQTAVPNASVPAFAATPPPLAAPINQVAPTPLVPEAAAMTALPPPAAVVSSQPAVPAYQAPLPPAAAAADPLPLPRPLTANPSVPGSVPGRTALGVRTVPVDSSVQSRFNLPEAHGAFVIGVVQDLPASRAGVPPGSVIVAINHQPVRSPQDLTHLVARGPVGTPVPIQYVLPGGQSKQADVVLQSLEQPLERALIGDGNARQTTEPPTLQPAPLTTRRVQPTSGYQSDDTAPLARLEELLRRMNNRLEQIERRLDRIESGR
jgi:S1-C subfamily serine protease